MRIQTSLCVGASIESREELQADGVRAQSVRFSFQEYGARGHRAGRGRKQEDEDGCARVCGAIEEANQFDPQRSAYIDSILARLRAPKVVEIRRAA